MNSFPIDAIFGFFPFAASLISFGNAVYLAPHWQNKSAGKLILLEISVGIWALGYSMEFFSPTLTLALWWVKAEYIGAAWVSLFVLDFVLNMTGNEKALPKKAFLILCGLPLTTILLVLTNARHHLLWLRAWMDFGGLVSVVAYVRGPWFWVFVSASYGMLAIATAVLIRAMIPARGLVKKQLTTILIGIAFPWCANILYLIPLKGGPLPDLTPVAFTISGLAFAWGLMRYQMLSLIPLAHDTIIESMTDPVISVDSHGRIMDVNGAARKTLSLDIPRPGALYLEDAFPALNRELMGHRRPAPVEAEISLEIQGQPRDWTMRIFPLIPRRGGKSGWLMFLKDITEAKKNQAALVESERIHRTMLQAAPNPVILYDKNRRVTHINPAFTRVFGWKSEEILGKVLDYIPEENSRQAQIALEEILDKKAIYDLITRRRTKTGELIDVSINAALCGTGDSSTLSMVVNITDITKIKETEKELRRTRNDIRSIINSMPSILIGLDTPGTITQWNKEAVRVTGVTEDKAKGMALEQAFPQLSARIPDIEDLIKTRNVHTASRVTLALKDGPMNADITVFPVASGANAVIRVDDVSHRMRLEEMMVQSEKMLSIGGLAAGMAHEINNPLAGMLQSLQVIQNRLTRDMPANLEAAEASGIGMDKLKDYLDRRQILTMMKLMTDSGLRAAQIVSNMLSFSRKSGQSKGPHHLSAILDDTIDLIKNDYRMKHQYDFKTVEILKEVAPGMPEIICQKGEIQQVLLNILKNGAEAMADAKTPSPRLTIRCFTSADRAVIGIRDNGPGMDAGTRKRIFEPFFTTKDVGVGTGLGLSVSYFIITETHGGTLSVESEPGRGTTFTITLPAGGHSPGDVHASR